MESSKNHEWKTGLDLGKIFIIFLTKICTKNFGNTKMFICKNLIKNLNICSDRSKIRKIDKEKNKTKLNKNWNKHFGSKFELKFWMKIWKKISGQKNEQ